MSRAKLGIRQNIEAALFAGWSVARAVHEYACATESTSASTSADYKYADSDLQCVMMRARKRWRGADKAHA